MTQAFEGNPPPLLEFQSSDEGSSIPWATPWRLQRFLPVICPGEFLHCCVPVGSLAAARAPPQAYRRMQRLAENMDKPLRWQRRWGRNALEPRAVGQTGTREAPWLQASVPSDQVNPSEPPGSR